MALPRDANNNVVQALQPIDGSLQRVSPTVGSASLVPLGNPTRACVVGVRVRSPGGIGHVRLGDAAVVAAVTDFPLTSDDGWMFISLAGKTGPDKKKITHLSLFAETLTVQADIVELE